MEDRTMTVSADIKYVGVNDHEIDLFEGQYIVPNGMAYNSYVIMDDKIAVMDTVDTEDHNISVKPFHQLHEFRSWSRQDFFKFIYICNMFR